jgi:hypothetical protein
VVLLGDALLECSAYQGSRVGEKLICFFVLLVSSYAYSLYSFAALDLLLALMVHGDYALLLQAHEPPMPPGAFVRAGDACHPVLTRVASAAAVPYFGNRPVSVFSSDPVC